MPHRGRKVQLGVVFASVEEQVLEVIVDSVLLCVRYCKPRTSCCLLYTGKGGHVVHRCLQHCREIMAQPVALHLFGGSGEHYKHAVGLQYASQL